MIYENAQNNDLVSQIDERIELFNLMLVKVKELINYKRIHFQKYFFLIELRTKNKIVLFNFSI